MNTSNQEKKEPKTKTTKSTTKKPTKNWTQPSFATKNIKDINPQTQDEDYGGTGCCVTCNG